MNKKENINNPLKKERKERKGISFFHKRDNDWKNIEIQPGNESIFITITDSNKHKLSISLNLQEISFLKDFLDSYLNEIMKNKIYGEVKGGKNYETKKKQL
jgi:hypothetical protein